jgi:LacI family transcriptional regulator
VGVVTQTIDSPFFGTALRGIEDELDRTGYIALFVSGHWNTEEELRCIDALRSRRADGIIVMSGRLGDAALRACAKSVPVVVTGRTLKAPNLFSLNFDNVTGARLATEHLLQLGHRRIAFIAGVPGHADAVERELGFRQGLAAAGITPDENLIVPGQFHEESGRLAMEQLLLGRHRFSAVLAANDQMAFGAALALHQRGMQVPQDVSLVGFDDLAPSTYTLPPLTTVHQPGYELGRLAAAAMLQLLAGSKPTIEMPPPRLVARESTARPRR